MVSHIYPEHIVSSYILMKAQLGENLLCVTEAESVLIPLSDDESIKLMRLTYPNSAIGRRSPEIRNYMESLCLMEQAFHWGYNQIMLLDGEDGLKYAAESLRELSKRYPDAPGKLEQAFKKIDKTPKLKRIVA